MLFSIMQYLAIAEQLICQPGLPKPQGERQ